KKETGINTEIPGSGLMAFNLDADQPDLGISLSGNLLTNAPMDYTSYTGIYRNIFPGDRPVEAFDFSNDSVLASASFYFEVGKYYSLFVTGNDGQYRNFIVHDDVDSLSASDGKAYFR